MDNDFLSYIMSLRQRAGAAGPSAGQRMNGAPNDRANVDDSIRGANPQAMAGLQNILAARMQGGGHQMPMPMDAYIDLARRAGAEDEARRRASAMLQQGAGQQRQAPPGPKLFGPGDPRFKAITDATDTNYSYRPPVGR